MDLLQLNREDEGNPGHEETQSPLHVAQPGQRMEWLQQSAHAKTEIDTVELVLGCKMTCLFTEAPYPLKISHDLKSFILGQ